MVSLKNSVPACLPVRRYTPSNLLAFFDDNGSIERDKQKYREITVHELLH